MLLYYFADKDDLIAATLDRIAQDAKALLDGASDGGERLPYDELLPLLVAATRTGKLRVYMRLWMELVAACARDDELYRPVAGRIARMFVEWIDARLLPDPESGNDDRALLMLATVDGIAQLDMVGVTKVPRSDGI